MDQSQQSSDVQQLSESNEDSRIINGETIGQIVNEQKPTDKVTQIMQLENMINGFMADAQKLRQQLKEQNQMYKDALENDAEYSQVLTKAREVAKEKKRIAEKLTQEPSLKVIETKVKDLKEEVKDAQDALGHYLVQYFEQSGLRQITDAAGDIHEIVTSVRLVKKRE